MLADAYLRVDTSAAAGRGHRGRHDAVPRTCAPLHAGPAHRAGARSTTPPPLPTALPAVTLRSVGSAAAGRRPSPTISPARSSTPARAIRRGAGRSATASRPSAPTISSSAPQPSIRSRTGWTSTKVGDPAGGRAAAPAGQPHPPPQPGHQAAPPLLVLPPQRARGGGDDRRRPRLRRISPAAGSSTAALSAPGCSVEDWECVRAHGLRLHRRAGRPTRRPGPSRRTASSSGLHVEHRLRGHHARAATPRTLASQLATFGSALPVHPAPHHQPQPLHRLQRLELGPQGRARPRNPFGHQLLLLAPEAGSRTGPGSSPARACPCASPTSTARSSTSTRPPPS